MTTFFITVLSTIVVPLVAGYIYHRITCKTCKGHYEVKNHESGLPHVW